MSLPKSGCRIGHDRHLTAAVGAVDLRRAFARLQRDEVRQGHRACFAGGNREHAQRLLAVAIRGFGTQMYIILLATLVVRGHIRPAHQQAQGGGEIRNVHPHLPRFRAVHLGDDFRFAVDQRGVHIADARDLAHLHQRRLRRFVDLVQIRSGNDVLHIGARLAGAERRHLKHRHAQVLGVFGDHLAAYPVHDLLLVLRPQRGINQPHIKGRLVWRALIVVANREQRVLHARHFANVACDALGHQVGSGQRAAFRRAQVHQELRLLSWWQQGLLHLPHHRPHTVKRRTTRQHHHPAMPH